MKTLPLIAASLAVVVGAVNPAAAQFASTGDGIFGNFYATDRNAETKDSTTPRPLAYQSQSQAQSKTGATVEIDSRAPLQAAGPWTPPWKRSVEKTDR
ncbi:hypothetical protein [Aurantimonas sp. HBX-1]|uniref:hypothetical protein n=1 Tax=Aurantimonas sp. HBX-1 TaxID=2906072 RepID=UPI001F43F1C7|nr:hypothetical protein [Aurantimonas sp. HBX-1]UIJ73912.1 hypothetical protein LXB15_09995 [Aurantimonas sp. HBX-1]